MAGGPLGTGAIADVGGKGLYSCHSLRCAGSSICSLIYRCCALMGISMGILEPLYSGYGGCLIALAHLMVQLHDAVPVLFTLYYISTQIRKRGACPHEKRQSNSWHDGHPTCGYTKLTLCSLKSIALPSLLSGN